jgi:hypothetical protein
LRLRKNRYANSNFGRLITVKSKLFTNFATRQLFLDPSDQIVRLDNSSVHVQGANARCEISRIQIEL